MLCPDELNNLCNLIGCFSGPDIFIWTQAEIHTGFQCFAESEICQISFFPGNERANSWVCSRILRMRQSKSQVTKCFLSKNRLFIASRTQELMFYRIKYERFSGGPCIRTPLTHSWKTVIFCPGSVPRTARFSFGTHITVKPDVLLHATLQHCDAILVFWLSLLGANWRIQCAVCSPQSRSLRENFQFGQVAGRVVASCKDLLENVLGVITVKSDVLLSNDLLSKRGDCLSVCQAWSVQISKYCSDLFFSCFLFFSMLFFNIIEVK